jgi:NADPH2:quinone reductase
MKAMVLKEFGSELVYSDVENPKLGAGQVLIEVRATALNPLDLKIKAGQAAHAEVGPPAILGLDVAGVVVEVAPGVTRFKSGDEVFGLVGGVGALQGGLAEVLAVDTDLLAKKPKNISMKEAASIPLAFITAWEGLVDRAQIDSNKTVLIHGGAGGVGSIAVQIAKSFKAKKIVATGSASNASRIERFGAIAVDYQATSVAEYVKKYTEGEGFDIVYDTVGGKTLDASFEAVKRYDGHVVSCLGWGEHKLAPLSFRSATYSGVFTLYPLLSGKGRKHHGEIMEQARILVEEGKLLPAVDPTSFTLSQANEAYSYFASAAGKGKVVIDV